MSYYSSSRNPSGTTTTTTMSSSLPGQQSSSHSTTSNSSFTNHQLQNSSTNPLSTNFDYSPLANQAYTYGLNSAGNNNGAGGSAASILGGQSSNGYVYNNSPLGNNAVMNQGNGTSAYNNLNLSTRSTQQGGIYPTPRGSNLSPNLNFASLYSARARFNASKGFDLEDDLEFCPEIHEHYSTQQHHRFNPYTANSFSPQDSPSASSAHTTSPITRKDLSSSSSNGNPETPRVVTPRAKKVLEIVNPVTGLRVGSPAPYK